MGKDIKHDKFASNEFAKKYKHTLKTRALHRSLHKMARAAMAPIDSTRGDVKK